MLQRINIANFAIIERQEIEFEAGLNVISGESGAGKSIILDAIRFVSGARARTDQIRTGQELLSVEAHFSLKSLPRTLLKDLPCIIAEDERFIKEGELLISREIHRSGKGKIYINGRLSQLSVLEDVGRTLISLCGQNQQLKLLEPTYQLEMLDSFASNQQLRAEYQNSYELWRTVLTKIEDATLRLEQSVLRRAELEFVVEELSKLELRPGLRSELEQQVKLLKQSEQSLETKAEIGQLLEGEGGIYERLSALQPEISQLKKYGFDCGTLSECFKNIEGSLFEFESELNQLIGSVEIDQEQLSLLAEKLDQLARVERKYRRDEAGLLLLLENSTKELQTLGQELELSKLKDQEQALNRQLLAYGEQLSKNRSNAAKRLSKAASTALSELNFKGANLSFALECGELGPSGLDYGELLLSSVEGEPLKPLKKIASGGELSRITLVLKTLLREQSGVNVLVFDEVDVGISGSVARAVGEKLSQLAQHSQVICITHLAQVASLADHHILVKKGDNASLNTQISVIKEHQQVEEIARMLAGYNITAASRESARELITSKLTAK